MRKSASYIILSVITVMLVCVSAYSQEEMEYVDNKVFKNPERPPAVFYHDEHNETADIFDDCAGCHHLYEDGQKLEDESSEDQRCSECHEPNASNGNLRLRKAFHKACKGCHLAEKKGPILCGECHIK